MGKPGTVDTDQTLEKARTALEALLPTLPAHAQGVMFEFARVITSKLSALRLMVEGGAWQMMDSVPTDRPFIVLWSDHGEEDVNDRLDVITWPEYDEIIGYGEPPALCWHEVPRLPEIHVIKIPSPALN